MSPNRDPRVAVQQNAAPCNNGKFTADPARAKLRAVNGLSERQLVAIDRMLQGAGDAEVAAELRVERSTVYRWRTGHPAFHVELERRRRQVMRQSVDRLRSLMPAALGILQQQMNDPKTALRAAAILLRLTGLRGLTVSAGGGGTAAGDDDAAAVRKSVDDEYWSRLRDYIDAPPPLYGPEPEPPRMALSGDVDEDDVDEEDDLDADPDGTGSVQ